ncbi:MAG: hypothetical protein ACRBN8_15610 [Nannocystales bacterium]
MTFASPLLATRAADRDRHLGVLAAFATTVTENSKLREELYAAPSAAHAYMTLHVEESTDLEDFLEPAIAELGTEVGPTR